MTQIGYCIFLDNKELEFRYKGKIFVIKPKLPFTFLNRF